MFTCSKDGIFIKLKPFQLEFFSHLAENTVLMGKEQLTFLCQGPFLVVGNIYIKIICGIITGL